MIDERLARKLEAIAQVPVLLVASDYDGVLSPIVADPAAAVPDEAALGALVRLGRLPQTHAVAISGRSRGALLRLAGAADGLMMIGTHGAEGLDYEVDEDLVQSVTALQDDLRSLARQYPGSEVEPKPIGAAFHFRNAIRGEQAAAKARAIAEAAGARTVAGKKVVECLFGDANKGSALRTLRATLGASAVVYVGDDITDEDAFSVLLDSDAGVKVGPGPTVANHRVAAQEVVAEVLEALESARRRAIGSADLS